MSNNFRIVGFRSEVVRAPLARAGVRADRAQQRDCPIDKFYSNFRAYDGN
jgi:hypothetical protein